MTDTITTSIGTFTTEPRAMNQLAVGDRFIHWVGSGDYLGGYAVYTVTQDCVGSDKGWLHVHELTLTDAQHASHGTEPGQDPRDGFFAYTTWPDVHRIVGER